LRHTLLIAPGGITGSVIVPGTVTSIGNLAFSGCTHLTVMTIPGSVTSIGNGAFYLCTGLTALTISQGVTSIGIGAFDRCSGLTAVTIPSSVTSIGGWAFQNCTGLTELNFLGAPPQLGEVLINPIGIVTTIVKYPKGSGATTWASYVGTLFGGLITQEST